MTKPNQENDARKRPTIAFVTANLTNSKLKAAWLGTEAAVQARGGSLVCFLTGELHNENNDPRRLLCDFIDRAQFDGLIVFQWWRSQEQFAEFYRPFAPMPVVNIMRFYDGHSGVTVDNYQGIRDQMSHLIEEHGYRRIACIRGPQGTTADERYQAYEDALAAYNIPFDDRLVAIGNFEESGGRAAILQLLEQHQNVGFEAVVVANDLMARGVLQELRAQQLRIPADVVVTGFDNESFASTTKPPLTTVNIPYYEMGQKAGEALLQQLTSQEMSGNIVVPAQHITRRSCGCFDKQTAALAEKEYVLTEETSLESILSSQRESIVPEMMKAVAGAERQWMEQLLDAFQADVLAQSPPGGAITNRQFLAALGQILDTIGDKEDEVSAWQGVISEIERYCWSGLLQHQPQQLGRAVTIWEQGRVFIGKTTQQIQLRRQTRQEQQTIVLNALGAELLKVNDADKVRELLMDRLPQLGIYSCCMALYADPDRPSQEARLMLAYRDQAFLDTTDAGKMYPSFQAICNDWLPPDRPYNFVVQALFVGEEKLGYLLFETEPGNNQLFQTVPEQISGALKRALLAAQQERTEKALAKRVAEMETVARVSAAASTVLETAELLQTVVDLTKVSFNLYHVHIYLLDEAKDSLVLTAGAGEIGRQLVEQGWRISLDSTQSFVALVARSQQGVFVNDVTDMIGYLPNPLLPDTHAEMAVPLMVGERVLGVLDVQSNTSDAFSEDDLQVQTTLAGQIAIALENARLLEQTQAALAEAEATQRRYLAETWQAFRRSQPILVHERQSEGAQTTLLNKLKKQAIEQGKLVAVNAQAVGTDQNGDAPAAMVVPLKLQGQVIGALGLQDVAKNRRWTEQEIALVEAVTEQVTQALERARLFEQTQQRAAREKVIADVTRNVWSSDNLERVMQTAVEQLGVKFDATKVVIRLGTEEQILASPYLTGTSLNQPSQPNGKAVPDVGQTTEL